MIQNTDDTPLNIHQPKTGPKLVADKKQGNNDPCACGSGKKYKKCCKVVHDADRGMQVQTMMKLLYCFVDGVEGKAIQITKRTVDTIPKDWAEKLHILIGAPDGEAAYLVQVEPDEEKNILTPDKQLVGPNGKPLR